MREALVRTRVRYISLVRALLRKQGYRVRCGAAGTFIRRVEELELPSELEEEIAPLLRSMAKLNEEITASNREVEKQSKTDERVERLMSAPGAGALTATSFVATVDGVERFESAHQLESYLGLVPREWSSGENEVDPIF